METISVNGETYIKGNILARELGYTSDYVGQLCRGGKVKAELVGRSWYVEPSSLKSHKRSRYRSVAKKSEEQIKREINRRKEVEQVASRPNFYSKLHHADVQYYQDEDDLFPSLKPREEREETLVEEVPLEYVEKHDDFESSGEWNAEPENDASFEMEEADVSSDLEVREEVIAVPITRESSKSGPAPRRRKNINGRLDIVALDQEESVLIGKRHGKSTASPIEASKKGSGGFKKAINMAIILVLLVVAGGFALTESHISTEGADAEAYSVNFDNYQLLLAGIRDSF